MSTITKFLPKNVQFVKMLWSSEPPAAAPSIKEILPSNQTPKGKSEVIPKPVDKNEHQEKTTGDVSQDKVEKVKSEPNEVNDNQYTIQKSTNPLKFKLKTGKELQNDDAGIPSSAAVPKVPL